MSLTINKIREDIQSYESRIHLCRMSLAYLPEGRRLTVEEKRIRQKNKGEKEQITDKNIRHGLTFRESKPHVCITDFSETAWRQVYVKALFYENEAWIKCIEAKEDGRIINSIVDCKDKHRTDRNLELQAELRDQVYNNLEYRKGYYEAVRDGKPTTKFNKHLHPDVRRFIQKYDRYKNQTEVLHGEDRKLSYGRLFDGTVQHEQRANRRIKKPKKFTIRQAQSKEKSILRRRSVKMVAQQPG